MCGISGILNYDPHKPVDHRLIESMNQALSHRGPDDGGYYVDGPVGLGTRRLSIIGVSSGHQPMSNEDGTVWITYNGETYNYAELRDELIARGHTFKTSSDTEVIVHLYEDMGADCVQKLAGMFGFAIWDRRRSSLLLVRDRLGIKPVYYFLGEDFLAFSSEIKGLLALNAISPQLNLQALHDYLTFRYTVAPETMIRNVYKLPPGHVLLAQSGRVSLRQYWDIDYSEKLVMSEEKYAAEFQDRLASATASHLMSEVPLGVLLSGGIDSTIVTSLVSEARGSGVKTFSVAFADDGQSYDERSYAHLAARHYGTEHHDIVITHEDFVRALPECIWHMDEPMADPASIPLYYVSQLARRHVTVILSGEGSDELFGGYGGVDLRGVTRSRWVRRIPAPFRTYLVKPLNDWLLESKRIQRYLELAKFPESHYFVVSPAYMANVFSEDAKWALYGARIKGTDHLRRSEELVVDLYRKTTHLDLLDQMLYVYTKQWLPDDLLLKADKMTMAHSLELRVPFLDHRIVEFVARLPVNMKIRRNGDGGYSTKYVLRKAFGRTLPEEILHRRKLGFPVPLKKLFQSPLTDLAQDVFGSKSLRDSGLFNTEKIASLLRENQSRGDRSEQLWLLIVFGLWCERFRVTA
jgi:asparagine synthase (glutamine-hydrolysing)